MVDNQNQNSHTSGTGQNEVSGSGVIIINLIITLESVSQSEYDTESDGHAAEGQQESGYCSLLSFWIGDVQVSPVDVLGRASSLHLDFFEGREFLCLGNCLDQS